MTQRDPLAPGWAPPPAPDALARARAAAARLAPKAATGAAPPDPGEVLAEVPRDEGRVLRVALRSYEGRPFVTLAEWEPGTGGHLWPVKGKQVTVRVRELAAVVEGLAAACDRVAQGRGAP